MKIKRIYAFGPEDAPEDWFNHVLWLWSQDECVPDGESLDEALCRLYGRSGASPLRLATSDQGDCIYALFSCGWVTSFGPGQRSGEVGVLVEPLRPARTGKPALKVHVNLDRLEGAYAR